MKMCLWRSGGRGKGLPCVSSVRSVDVYCRVINSVLSYCSPVMPWTRRPVLISHFRQGSSDLRYVRQFFTGRETKPLKLFKAQTLGEMHPLTVTRRVDLFNLQNRVSEAALRVNGPQGGTDWFGNSVCCSWLSWLLDTVIHLYAWKFVFNSAKALLQSTGGRYENLNLLPRYKTCYGNSITVVIFGGDSVK